MNGESTVRAVQKTQQCVNKASYPEHLKCPFKTHEKAAAEIFPHHKIIALRLGNVTILAGQHLHANRTGKEHPARQKQQISRLRLLPMKKRQEEEQETKGDDSVGDDPDRFKEKSCTLDQRPLRNIERFVDLAELINRKEQKRPREKQPYSRVLFLPTANTPQAAEQKTSRHQQSRRKQGRNIPFQIQVK